MECPIAAFVGESRDTNTHLQMPLATIQDPRILTVHIQMVCPSLTGDLASMCGRMQQGCRRKQTTTVMPVLVGKSLVTYHHPLLVTTTIASRPIKGLGSQSGISMTPCGTGMAVPMTTTAALMQVYRGSAGHCQPNQRKTLRCAYAVTKTKLTKTSEWNFWNYSSTNQ